MLEEIRKRLLEQPEVLQKILEDYGFCNIKAHRNYLSFGRDAQSSAKAIVIRLENNKYCYVKDYGRNIDKDIFSYLMMRRGESFKDVLTNIKAMLGMDQLMASRRRAGAFGGWYNGIRKGRQPLPLETYPEEILDRYEQKANVRFLRDNISLETQRYFGIRFDPDNNGIVIPVRDQIGSLVGVKIRNNWDSYDSGFQKYWYAVPAPSSRTLYGYSQNYSYLAGNDVLIFEAEKGTMQAFSYGYRNAVSLGSGSLSPSQAKMLLELDPKSIVFLHDNGYSLDGIRRNMDVIRSYSRFSEIRMKYWDYRLGKYPAKCSATDLGKKEFVRILHSELSEGDLWK